MSKMKKKYIIYLTLGVLCILLTKPYIQAEIFTYKYGYQFQNLYKQVGLFEDVKMFKIIEYSSKKAVVYYDNSISVFICYFSKSEEWKLDDWKCIWAKYGNANEWFYPYYPHTKENFTENHIFK